MTGRSGILAMVLVALIALGSTTIFAAAQSSPGALQQQLPGLESAHARSYVAPGETSMCTCSYGEQVVTAAAAAAVATVLEFDNAEHARAAFTTAQEPAVAATFVDPRGLEEAGFEEVEAGDDARLAITQPGGEGTAYSGLVIILDGDLVHIVSAKGPNDTIRDVLLDFGAYMVAAEPGAGDGTFAEKSGSHGGTFDVLPAADDTEVLAGLVPTRDDDLLAGS